MNHARSALIALATAYRASALVSSAIVRPRISRWGATDHQTVETLPGDELPAPADRLPNLWQGTVLDGELTVGRFEGTMSALLGSKRFRPSLRVVVFDVPVLLGADLRGLPWQERRDELQRVLRRYPGDA
jgi:hypothetical protein